MRARSKIIASDIDGVITEFVDPFTQFINARLGTNFDYRKLHNVDIAISYNLDPTLVHRLHEEFVAENHYRHLPFVDGAIEALNALMKDYELVLITSRRDDLEHTTRDWCTEHLPKAKLFFSHGKGNSIAAGAERRCKEDMAKEIGAVCLIEDNPHEFTDWNTPDILPICYARAQNEVLAKTHPHIPRLTWPGIVRHLGR